MLFRRKKKKCLKVPHGPKPARGVRFLLRFNMYLFLAQYEQMYLFLAPSQYKSIRTTGTYFMSVLRTSTVDNTKSDYYADPIPSFKFWSGCKNNYPRVCY